MDGRHSVAQELWLFYSSSGDFNERGVGRNWPGGDIKYVTTKNMGASWSEVGCRLAPWGVLARFI